MGVSAEILRNIQEATDKGNEAAIEVWRAQLKTIESLEGAKVIEQLPHANQIVVEKPVENVAVPSPEPVILTPSQLVEKLHDEYKRNLGKDIKFPEPQPEFLEMHRILEGEGFRMDPIAYLSRGKVAYALIDRSVRPNYDGGRQLFEDDGYVPILERGRRDGKIEVTSWVKDVPAKSRFGVSWNEIHNYVAPEVVRISMPFTRLVEETETQFRVPTKAEFQFAGKLRYAHFGTANTWEWLHDNSVFDCRLLGGRSDVGGLGAVGDGRPGGHDDYIAFRLEAVLPPQKLG